MLKKTKFDNADKFFVPEVWSQQNASIETAVITSYFFGGSSSTSLLTVFSTVSDKISHIHHVDRVIASFPHI